MNSQLDDVSDALRDVRAGRTPPLWQQRVKAHAEAPLSANR
jgi:hypothetical protein